MAFNIVISEVKSMVEESNESIVTWVYQLLQLKSKFLELINDSNLGGKGAEAIKANLNDVYVFSIDSIITVLKTYNTQLALYSGNLLEIENSKYGCVNDEYMEEISKKIEEYITETDIAYDNYIEAVKDITDLMDVSISDKSSYKTDLEGEKDRIDKLIDRINDLDNGLGGSNTAETKNIAVLIEGVLTIFKNAVATKIPLTDPTYTELMFEDVSDEIQKVKKELDDYNVKEKDEVAKVYDTNGMCGYDYTLDGGTIASTIIDLLLWAVEIDDFSDLSDFLDANASDVDSLLNKIFSGVKITNFWKIKDIVTKNLNNLSADEYKDLIKELLKFVPKSVNDGTILRLFDELAEGLPTSIIYDHYYWNMTEWEKIKGDATKSDSINHTEYIEYQYKLNTLEYGMQDRDLSNYFLNGAKINASHNTCEVIATYNTLLSLGNKNYDFPSLLSKFEKNGITLNGYFGTSPNALNDFFKSEGYETKMVTGSNDSASFSDLQDDYDSFVVTVYNDKSDVSHMIHTMSITREYNYVEKKYEYRLHNSDHTSGYTSGDSVEDVINSYNGGNCELISIIGVK